ncbi:RES family NAD+ phosphorylase [Fictibacillus sp. KU28468]|uniref:RES family NAD+ phosphorylase n=1 Tax=Fictibacillus sp. KU28468 TaxID=2991053 RepID=UPI00223CA8E2|nr:RES family NAD+ phosphorylase [Fictibacillus sp. KU28468]UZJ78750.1 RES family NAD+ phosphorylase [Fictibacillus sp. KU28468]
MNCCVKCFTSSEIKSMIKSLDNLGDCDYCGCRNVYVYNLQHDNKGLDEQFNNLLNIFHLGEELRIDGFSEYKLISIKDEFEKNWKIFNNFNGGKIHRFLNTLLEQRYPEKIEFLNNQVGIIEWMNKDYLEENSVLKGHSWEEFVTYIKHNNRFHSKHVNYKVLNDYIDTITITVDEDDFYRARISNNAELGLEDMGAPPPSLATAGRANSEGISHLYLASEKETVISEIRPSIGDTVYIGKFPIRQKLKVVDFRLLKSLDVFSSDDPTRYAINLEIFHEMTKAISKPVRSGDSKLEYLPTQFFVDYIKGLNETESAGYNGIIFESTLSTNGYNLMIFDPDLLSCTRVERRIIKTLNYTHIEYAID